MSRQDDITRLAGEVGAELARRGLMLITAESCTGGGIGEAMTRIPGSSRWFAGGVVAYSYAAKTALLGVDPETLQQRGAVSREIALQMARGAVARLAGIAPREAPPQGLVAIAVTGVAGPDGGTAGKPVGTVCFAWSVPGRDAVGREHFPGDRAAVREQSILHALHGLLEQLAALA